MKILSECRTSVNLFNLFSPLIFRVRRLSGTFYLYGFLNSVNFSNLFFSAHVFHMPSLLHFYRFMHYTLGYLIQNFEETEEYLSSPYNTHCAWPAPRGSCLLVCCALDVIIDRGAFEEIKPFFMVSWRIVLEIS